MFAKTHSAQATFLEGKIIDVETDVSKGLHNFSIVGLPDKGVEESKDRVSAAIKNSGLRSPKSSNQKIVVSLAPADLKKEGPVFDLAIALGYLLACKDINFNPHNKIFLGELSLDGTLREIDGTLPLVLAAKESGFEEVYIPLKNAKEASLVEGIKVFAVENLKTVIDHLQGKESIAPFQCEQIFEEKILPEIDFADIRGQQSAKRGLLIAAAGGHNVAMYGPPGTGKSMLAKAFPYLLPELSFEDMLEVTSIHSIAGVLRGNIIKIPPFRSPHHTSSYVAVVGGGAYPKPGEVTLSHKGVLFLDEFPEFERRVIEALRQPLEDQVINISRAKGSIFFPADFMLITALNPCPCGNYGSEKACVCSAVALQRYRHKISGPIADRIDIWLEVSKVDYASLGEKNSSPESEKMRDCVRAARLIQKERGLGNLNARVAAKNILSTCLLSDKAKHILDTSAEKLGLSGRGYHKTIKVARTIADIEGASEILPSHILESLQYRFKEDHA